MRHLLKMRVEFIAFLFLLVHLHWDAISQDHPDITRSNMAFIAYPDFPDANSTWGSIGYNPVTNSVFIGVTNHKNKIGLYEYTVKSDQMKLKGFISDMANLRTFQWQGKVHTKIVTGSDGIVYFGTDGGESREEYLMEHPYGYAGGFIMKYDPKTEVLQNLGMPLQYESIKDVDIDPETGLIYAVSYPQVHFLVFNPKTNEMRDLGRLGSAHVPRVLFTDHWGNCYYVDWRQRLVKYEKSTGSLVFASESLPAFPGTPGEKIITGVKTYAKDPNSGTIYLLTYGAKVLSFKPTKTGIGEVVDLGPVFEAKDRPLWEPYTPNLNLGANGKLYYFIGGHGNYVRKDTTLLVEMDPKTKHKRIVLEFSTSEISEVTGSGVTDNEGNLYFAGRRSRSRDEADKGESINDDVSVPFMIKFNPLKPIK